MSRKLFEADGLVWSDPSAANVQLFELHLVDQSAASATRLLDVRVHQYTGERQQVREVCRELPLDQIEGQADPAVQAVWRAEVQEVHHQLQ